MIPRKPTLSDVLHSGYSYLICRDPNHKSVLCCFGSSEGWLKPNSAPPCMFIHVKKCM